MKRLFEPIDNASLIFFRIVFAVLGFIDIAISWGYKHLYKREFEPDGFQFRYYGFEWVDPLPEPFMNLSFVVILLAAIGILLGWRYRLCTTIFAIGFTYTFLLEKAYYLNHGYLFCVLSFMMIFLPAHTGLSQDVISGRVKRQNQIACWPIFLLCFSMGIVYFFGGIAKINIDWLNARPLIYWLENKSDLFIIGPLIAQDWVAWGMSYGGLFLDLFVVLLLINRKLRIWGLLFVLFFHFVNLLVFSIGIFPFLSVALTLLFFDPDFPRVIWNRLSSRFGLFRRIEDWWSQKTVHVPIQAIDQPTTRNKTIITYLIIGYGLMHVLLPLRHWYFPGTPAWTEEGHRYSWRMMLRSKRGYGTFKVVDNKTGEEFKERPKNYLNSRQKRKMLTHPDMILQYAHFLRDKYLEEGHESVSVYANIKCKLNGRAYQVFIDPEIDLAQVEWSYTRPSEWIVPFEWTEALD